MTRVWKLLLDRVFRRDVFISHSSVDRREVDWFRRELEQLGYAPNKSKPGHDFRKRIENQIKTSTGAVLVETPDSRQSTEVGEEVYHIVHYRIRLVPVLRRGESVRPEIGRIDWVDFVGIDLFSEEDKGRREQKLGEIDAGLRGAGVITRLTARSLSLRTVLLACMVVVLVLVSIQAFSALAFVRDVEAYVADEQSYVVQAENRLPSLPQPTDPAVRLNGTWAYTAPGETSPLAIDRWENGYLRRREFFRDGRLIATDSYVFADRTPLERVRTYILPKADVTFVDRFSSDGALTQRLRVVSGTGQAHSTEAMTFRSPLPPPWMMFYR